MGSLTLDHDVHLRRVYRQLLHLVRDRQKWRAVKAVYHQVCRACIRLYIQRCYSWREYIEMAVFNFFCTDQRGNIDIKYKT